MNRDPVRDTDIEGWLDDEPAESPAGLRLPLRVIVLAVVLLLTAGAALGFWSRP